MAMPTAVVLSSSHDLGAWSAKAARAPVPGGALPYGIQHLDQAFQLSWADGHHHGIWSTRAARAVGGAVRRAAPGLQGSVAAMYARSRTTDADVAISIFEDAGLGFARVQGLSTSERRRPHVMVTCWLAEDCQTMPTRQLRSIRRSLKSISCLVVFSSNQVDVLADCLEIEPKRIAVVPFGVDTAYYNRSAADGPTAGGGVVAVGGDSRRDYATLAAAARMTGIPLTLGCYPRNLAGIDLPQNVNVVTGISHEDYRRLLLAADVVVTPTTAPAYPSGQSVVLEAMSLGKATLTTDSPAMRDYVTDGIDGMLIPAFQPAAIADAIKELLANPDRRDSLGKAAAETAHRCFNLEEMWRSISDRMAASCRGTGYLGGGSCRRDS
jgi:hypothetical protein